MLKFLIFSGSMRKGQYTEHVTKFVYSVAKQYPDTAFQIIDPRKLNLAFDDEGQTASLPELTQKVQEADGYIIISPEYNHGYPGSLKYILDLNLKQYVHKPVAFVGVSSGPFGGTRAIQSLLSVVRELGMVATFTDVNVSNVQEEVKNGKFKDPEKWQKRIKPMFKELIWMAKVLQHGREKINQ